MPAKLKTILLWLVVAFLVYAVVRNPEQAANVIKTIWDIIYGTLNGFVQFFASLTG